MSMIIHRLDVDRLNKATRYILAVTGPVGNKNITATVAKIVSVAATVVNAALENSGIAGKTTTIDQIARDIVANPAIPEN